MLTITYIRRNTRPCRLTQTKKIPPLLGRDCILRFNWKLSHAFEHRLLSREDWVKEGLFSREDWVKEGLLSREDWLKEGSLGFHLFVPPFFCLLSLYHFFAQNQ